MSGGSPGDSVGRSQVPRRGEADRQQSSTAPQTPRPSPPPPVIPPALDAPTPPPDLRTRSAGSAETRSPPAAAPDSCGPDGGAPFPGRGKRRVRDGGGMLGRRGERRRACWPDPHRTGHPDSLHLGGRRQTGACDSPSRGKKVISRLMSKRPSDRRSPGRNPGPQGAFEVSMINVSCNSH